MGIVGSHRFTVIILSLLSIFLLVSLIPNLVLICTGPFDWEKVLHLSNALFLIAWGWYSLSVYLECRHEREMKELAREEARRLQMEIISASFLIKKGLEKHESERVRSITGNTKE